MQSISALQCEELTRAGYQMKLTHVRIGRLGPFYFKHEIEIDPFVTILTGSNDAGKSSTLNLIHLFLNNQNAGEMDVNQDYLQEAQAKWMEDPTPIVECQFNPANRADAPTEWQNHYRDGDFALVTKTMTVKGADYKFEAHMKTAGIQRWPIRMPSVIFPSGQATLREQIDLSAPNPLEPQRIHRSFMRLILHA